MCVINVLCTRRFHKNACVQTHKNKYNIDMNIYEIHIILFIFSPLVNNLYLLLLSSSSFFFSFFFFFLLLLLLLFLLLFSFHTKHSWTQCMPTIKQHTCTQSMQTNKQCFAHVYFTCMQIHNVCVHNV